MLRQRADELGLSCPGVAMDQDIDAGASLLGSDAQIARQHGDVQPIREVLQGQAWCGRGTQDVPQEHPFVEARRQQERCDLLVHLQRVVAVAVGQLGMQDARAAQRAPSRQCLVQRTGA